MMTGPLIAVASRAALYPIQSIIIIALLVSGAYFHLLDIARNPPPSSVAATTIDLPRVSAPSTIWARKQNDVWKWTVDPVMAAEVRALYLSLLMDSYII
jgi:N-terminal domain with HPIH motif